jgi:hypothetical protein
MFGTLHAENGVSVDGDRVVQPAVLFYAPTIVLAVILIVVIRELRAWRRRRWLRAYGYPPHL